MNNKGRASPLEIFPISRFQGEALFALCEMYVTYGDLFAFVTIMATVIGVILSATHNKKK